jgi:eukaryotic-like serine/threonine-protein kinase
MESRDDASNPSQGGDSTSGRSRTVQERISRHQHAADVMRARSVLVTACTMWLVSTVLDVAVHGTLGTGSLRFVVAVRFATTIFHVAVIAPLFRTPLPAPRVANVLIASVFPVTCFALMLIATQMGGLTSPYASAVFVIVMSQTITQPQPWQRGALLAALSSVLYPAGMLVASLLDADLAAQLHDMRAISTFVTFLSLVAVGSFVAVRGGHVTWSLRQSVFESRKLGRYRLLKRIGKGGMGEVWRAEDRALRRNIALKILPQEAGRKPSTIARFEREIQATASIAHPNVVRVHDWGVTDDGVWYYAMDLLEGTDLQTVIRRCGPMPPALALHLLVPAARGLAEAHSHGIVHRDIKPGNMFVVVADSEPLRIELFDFGIAHNGDDAELTLTGMVMGTPGFIAPEVLAGAPGGVSADIYGFAASFYYALTGATPRETRNTPVSTLIAGIPAELDAAISDALEAEPARRPASAVALADRLVAVRLSWTGSWRIDQDPSLPPPSVDPKAPPPQAKAPVTAPRA